MGAREAVRVVIVCCARLEVSVGLCVLRGGVTSRQQIQLWGPRDLGRGFGDKVDDKQTLPVPSH